MHVGRILLICDCCAQMVANSDTSSCKDYYGHEHTPAQYLSNTFSLEGESSEVNWTWICDGCGTDMLAHSNQWSVVELIPTPHQNYPHHPGYLPGCPACEDHCNCGVAVARGHEVPCVWPGHEDNE